MSDQKHFAFQKANYIIMLIGVFTLIIGFTIMSSDSEVMGFGKMGLTVGPIVVMLGFLVEFVAILYKPKKSNSDSE